MERSWRFPVKSLAIEGREIRAVLVLQHVLAIFDKDVSVHTRYATLFSTMRSQVHIGADVADGVFAANHNVIFAAYVELLIVCLDDEPRVQCRRSCDRSRTCSTHSIASALLPTVSD